MKMLHKNFVRTFNTGQSIPIYQIAKFMKTILRTSLKELQDQTGRLCKAGGWPVSRPLVCSLFVPLNGQEFAFYILYLLYFLYFLSFAIYKLWSAASLCHSTVKSLHFAFCICCIFCIFCLLQFAISDLQPLCATQ